LSSLAHSGSGNNVLEVKYRAHKYASDSGVQFYTKYDSLGDEAMYAPDMLLASNRANNLHQIEQETSCCTAAIDLCMFVVRLAGNVGLMPMHVLPQVEVLGLLPGQL
jgi:hypothetical protein